MTSSQTSLKPWPILVSSSPRLRAGLWPELNDYSPYHPHAQQALFLLMPHREALYGGAAGGGKSDSLLQAALQYVHVPGYSAVIFRRTYPQLTTANGLIPRSMDWLAGTDASWNEQKKTWTFPSGATLRFGHLQYEKTVYDWQGSELQYIAWDELTHFSEFQYTYMLSRLRRAEGVNVPLRVRSGSNPGGVGHTWVKRRFLLDDHPERIFIPARLEHNPSLDTEEYDATLSNLGSVEYRRLRHGDWDIEQGDIFDRAWFRTVQKAPEGIKWVRYWDLATTAKQTADRTAGALCGYQDGCLYIADIVAGRWEWPKAKRRILTTAALDGREVVVGVEAISGFKIAAQELARTPELRGYTLRVTTHVTGDKVARSGPWAARAERGQVRLVDGPWVSDFLDEVVSFPSGRHDDRVDAVSGAVKLLSLGLSRPPAFGAPRASSRIY